MKDRNRTDYIVIHTAGWPGDSSVEDIRRVHIEENGWEDIGYHFVIRKNGEFETGRDVNKVGAHCRAAKMNYRSIGICCSGHGDQEPFTDEQMETLRLLVNSFRNTMAIPIGNVLGHREAGANKSCPGEKVNMNEVRRFIKDGKRIADLSDDSDSVDDGIDYQVPNDENENGVSDEFEEPIDSADPVDAVKSETADGKRDKKGFWNWMRETAAGENTAGKIGAPVKDFVLSLVPGGKYIDSATDEVGDQLKQNTNQSSNTMPEVKTNTSVGKWIKNRLREPSTYQGIAIAVGAIWGSVDPEAIEAIGTGVLSIIGGIQMLKKEKEDPEEEEN